MSRNKLDMWEIAKKDFSDILEDIGEDVTLYRSTKTISNVSGGETISFGSAETIKGIFQINTNEFVYSKEGIVQMGDATLWVYSSHSINDEDKITYNSVDYIVHKKLSRFNVDQLILYRWNA